MKPRRMGSKGRWMVVLGWLDPSVGMVTAIILLLVLAYESGGGRNVERCERKPESIARCENALYLI